jgi:transmembrane sensor
VSLTEAPDTRSTVEVEAAAWIAQLNGKGWSPADQAALREWCLRSHLHRDSLKRLASTWIELDALANCQATESWVPAGPSGLKWNRFWATHVAAIGIVVIMLVAWVGSRFLVSWPPSVELYATRIGEQRSIQLPDHSTIHLNTNSLLEVDFRQDERRLRLVKGEALFEVAKDLRRPFIVNAAGSTVRALGTIFSVRITRDDVEVVVSRGAVSVQKTIDDQGSTEMRPLPSPILHTREVAVLRDRAPEPIVITTVNSHELEKKLAWTDGVLEFDGEPLEKVVAEVSRYTPVKVTIADPELRSIPVGGRFRIGETQALFDVIQASFGAEITYQKDSLVITRNTHQH